MKTLRTAMAAAGLLAALTVGACSNHSTTPTRPTPTVQPVTAVPTPADYTSAAQLALVLNKSGLPCSPLEPVDNPSNGAVDMATCGDDLNISIYRDHTDAMGAPAYLKALVEGLGLTENVVVGANWTVQCDSRCGPVANVLHGDQITVS